MRVVMDDLAHHNMNTVPSGFLATCCFAWPEIFLNQIAGIEAWGCTCVGVHEENASDSVVKILLTIRGKDVVCSLLKASQLR